MYSNWADSYHPKYPGVLGLFWPYLPILVLFGGSYIPDRYKLKWVSRNFLLLTGTAPLRHCETFIYQYFLSLFRHFFLSWVLKEMLTEKPKITYPLFTIHSYPLFIWPKLLGGFHFLTFYYYYYLISWKTWKAETVYSSFILDFLPLLFSFYF